MSINDDTENTIVVGLQFGDDMCAITYMEPRDLGDGAVIQRTLMIDPDQVEEEIMAVNEAIRVLIDEGLLVLREASQQAVEDGSDAQGWRRMRFKLFIAGLAVTSGYLCLRAYVNSLDFGDPMNHAIRGDP